MLYRIPVLVILVPDLSYIFVHTQCFLSLITIFRVYPLRHNRAFVTA